MITLNSSAFIGTNY